ncbi:MAG TPA: hypothetical protein VF881_10115 [Polyangiaceae bacterium]
MDIAAMIVPAVNRQEIAHVLDDVAEHARLKSVMDLGRRELSALYEAAADNPPLTLDHFVPAGIAPLTEVIHEGKNSLGMFTRFQKRFCLPDRPTDRKELWGYNEQSLRLWTGPGYFVAYEPSEGGVLIDYTRLPTGKPDAWPPILSNSARLSRFIYNGTQDMMRSVSRHVSIGRARRGTKVMDAWFVLVRRDPANGASTPGGGARTS